MSKTKIRIINVIVKKNANFKERHLANGQIKS